MGPQRLEAADRRRARGQSAGCVSARAAPPNRPAGHAQRSRRADFLPGSSPAAAEARQATRPVGASAGRPPSQARHTRHGAARRLRATRRAAACTT
eukprot:scaffold243_cov254-Prasinococcus_capsulatus_cf.AAC.1